MLTLLYFLVFLKGFLLTLFKYLVFLEALLFIFFNLPFKFIFFLQTLFELNYDFIEALLKAFLCIIKFRLHRTHLEFGVGHLEIFELY